MANNKKRLFNLINASLGKRYKHFIRTVVDMEMVWLLDGGEGYCTYDDENGLNIIVYPSEEVAICFADGATPVKMEIHDFCKECRKLISDNNINFAVFPNKSNFVQVSPQILYEDLLMALEEVEDLDEDMFNE